MLPVKLRAKSTGKIKHTQLFALLLVPVVTLILGTVAQKGWAFEETIIRWEVNSTDKDAGLQIQLDGEGWEYITVENPSGEEVFSARVSADLEDLGGTELFLESGEPPYEDLTGLQELLDTQPTGNYRFDGETIEGESLSGRARLTQNIPAGPVINAPAEGAVVQPNAPLLIDWEPVTTSIFGPSGIQIVAYQIIVELEDTPNIMDVKVPDNVTQVTVPPEILVPGEEYKFEVLAIERTGNQTITESFFETAE